MIKIYLVFPIALLCSFVSFSQDYSDMIIISGSVGGKSSHSYEEDSDGTHSNKFDYRINLKAGYFFWKRSSVGIYSGYSYHSGKTTVNDTVKSGHKFNDFYIGPYYKQYFKLLYRFSFTMFTSAYFNSHNFKPYLESSYPRVENSYNLTFIPGLSYDITDRLSVDMDIGEFTAYIMTFRRKDPTLDEESQKSVVLGTYTSLNKFRITTFVLGFSYRIGK